MDDLVVIGTVVAIPIELALMLSALGLGAVGLAFLGFLSWYLPRRVDRGR